MTHEVKVQKKYNRKANNTDYQDLKKNNVLEVLVKKGLKNPQKDHNLYIIIILPIFGMTVVTVVLFFLSIV